MKSVDGILLHPNQTKPTHTMKIKSILTALAVVLSAIAQPALAGFTQEANGNPTHYNGIPIPPMQTVAEARAATEKRLAAIKAEEAKQAAQAATEIATRNPSPATAPQELFFTGKPYLEETGQYLFLFRHYDPELARWTTADPSGFPNWANNYLYSLNPTNGIDPNGLEWVVNTQVNFDLFNWENNHFNISLSWNAPTNADANPWDLGQEWLFGVGPQTRDFGLNDHMTSYVIGHSAVNSARNTITSQIKANSGSASPVPVSYDLSGLAGIPKYFGDYSTLLTFGNTGNLGVTFLGSYKGQVSVVNVSQSTGTAEIEFSIVNNSTIGSATRPPVVGYWDWWQEYVASRITNLADGGGPMSTKTQNFVWRETVPFE
jgi:RHS repeat-associated protein